MNDYKEESIASSAKVLVAKVSPPAKNSLQSIYGNSPRL